VGVPLSSTRGRRRSRRGTTDWRWAVGRARGDGLPEVDGQGQKDPSGVRAVLS
jgi:hypothetical protein